MDRRERAGFTLIELLVVVAIISLLAAIAIPNVAGRLRKARMTKAEAEIRGLETAVEMFRTDTGYLPFYALSTTGWTALAGLGYNQLTDVCELYTTGMLEAILKSTKLYADNDFFKGGVVDTVQRMYMPKGIPLDPWKEKYVYVERHPHGGRTCFNLVPQIEDDIQLGRIDLDYYIYSKGEDQFIYDPYGQLQANKEHLAEPVINDDISNWDVDRTYQKEYR